MLRKNRKLWVGGSGRRPSSHNFLLPLTSIVLYWNVVRKWSYRDLKIGFRIRILASELIEVKLSSLSLLHRITHQPSAQINVISKIQTWWLLGLELFLKRYFLQIMITTFTWLFLMVAWTSLTLRTQDPIVKMLIRIAWSVKLTYPKKQDLVRFGRRSEAPLLPQEPVQNPNVSLDELQLYV